MLAAQLDFLTRDDLRWGHAVYRDITNEYLHYNDSSLPLFSANSAENFT